MGYYKWSKEEIRNGAFEVRNKLITELTDYFNYCIQFEDELLYDQNKLEQITSTYRLGINNYRGHSQIQLFIEHIEPF